jgi:hypothetical protein
VARERRLGGKHASSKLPTSCPAIGSETDPVSGAPLKIHSWIALSSPGVSGAVPTGIGLPSISMLPGSVAARSFSYRKLSVALPGWTRACLLFCDAASTRFA